MNRFASLLTLVACLWVTSVSAQTGATLKSKPTLTSGQFNGTTVFYVDGDHNVHGVTPANVAEAIGVGPLDSPTFTGLTLTNLTLQGSSGLLTSAAGVVTGTTSPTVTSLTLDSMNIKTTFNVGVGGGLAFSTTNGVADLFFERTAPAAARLTSSTGATLALSGLYFGGIRTGLTFSSGSANAYNGRIDFGSGGSASGSILASTLSGTGIFISTRLGISTNTASGMPGGLLHLAAGTTSLPPLLLSSGALTTTPASGAVEFLTDKYYGTITTGTARKEIALLEGSLSTSNRILYADANGRITDTVQSAVFSGQSVTFPGGGQVFSPGGGYTSITDNLLTLGSDNGTGYQDFMQCTLGSLVFNVRNLDMDFKIHGDVNNNLLHADAALERIGVKTDAPASVLDNRGSISPGNTVETTTNYAITGTDFLINVTTGTVTLTLPTSTTATNRLYKVINSGAGVVTLTTTGGQTITGTTGTITTSNSRWASPVTGGWVLH